MDTHLNAEEKMLCPCNRCKYQVARLRRICDDHSRKWGIFSREILDRVLGSSSIDPTVNPLDIQPERGTRPSVPLTSQVHEQQVKENLETFYEQSMDDMLDALHDTDTHNDREDSPRHTENISNEQKEMRRLAHLPLYSGAKVSVLRASLSILNLQSIYGWSDTSVSKLLGYVFCNFEFVFLYMKLIYKLI